MFWLGEREAEQLLLAESGREGRREEVWGVGKIYEACLWGLIFWHCLHVLSVLGTCKSVSTMQCSMHIVSSHTELGLWV